MDEILNYWRVSYYTNLLNLILVIVGLVVSISKWEKNSIFNSLTFLFLAYLLPLLVALIDLATNHKFPAIRLTFSFFELFTTIIELLVFSHLIKNFIKISRLKKAIGPIPYLFFIYLIILFLLKNQNGKIDQVFLQNVFTVQALFLIIECICYYIDLFKKEPNFQLLNEPSFWIVTGLSFCMVSTFPCSILGQIIMTSNYNLYMQLFIIFNIFYGLLFLMIIRSFLCKQQRAK